MFYTMGEGMNLTTDSDPSFVFKLVKTTGFSPRIFLGYGKFGWGIGGEVMVFRSFNRRCRQINADGRR
jgi:hypothetical protein